MKRFRTLFLAIVMIAVMIASVSVLAGCDGNGGEDDYTGPLTYTITVTRSGGYPFSGVSVVAYDSQGGVRGYGSTDENGVATFEAPADTYTLKFGQLPEGYKGDDNYVVTKKNPNATFNLSASLIETPATMATKYQLGDVMHDFSFVDTLGNESSISQILQTKKAVMLNFWYVGCTWCKYEFPGLASAYQRYLDDVEVIAINPYEDSEDVEDYRNNANGYYDWERLPFTMVSAEESYTRTLLSNFSIQYYPTSVFIDREGVVCHIIEGADSESTFISLFELLTKEPYNQKILFPGVEIVDKPDVEAPTSQQIQNAINNTASGMASGYYFEDDEYNWPWVVEGNTIKASNTGHDNTYAILNSDMPATTNSVIAFDFKISSEADCDMFYVFVDGVITHSFSGNRDWQTCYAFVPEVNGIYTLSFVYYKDESKAFGDDTVSIRNMRYESLDNIGEYAEIMHCCATGKIVNGQYSHYSTVVYNEADGYYHVGTVDGPLLIADLMNATAWSNDSAWNYALGGGIYLDVDNDGFDEELTDIFTDFCRYANNSKRYGKIAVTRELKICLDALVYTYSEAYENEWLELCYYYTVFNGAPVSDPIEGRSYYTAYSVVVNQNGAENPDTNHVLKDTMIMPRGVWFKFVPTETAVYRVHSIGEVDTFVWIDDANLNTIIENDDDETFVGSPELKGNFSVTMLFQRGVTYYIRCDFFNTDALGEFDFVIDKLASSGYVWDHASFGGYVQEIGALGDVVGIKVGGAINYALGDDNCYHVLNDDGTLGGLIYIDLTQSTYLFPSMSIEQMVDMSCYYCKHCGYLYLDSVAAFERTQKPICYLCGVEGKDKFEKRKVFELPTPLRDQNGNILAARYDYEDGNVMYVPLYELNTSESLNTENYLTDLVKYGIKFVDYTDVVKQYIANSKNPAYYPNQDELFDTGSHVGCIAASKELVDVLSLFIVFGDYGYLSLDNVWLMMAYYYNYLG